MEFKRKNSIKRTAILMALRDTKDHPTAEMLYERLKPKFPDLSLGTVYRNLTMFCNEQEAVRIVSVNGRERFDGRRDEHAHFICRRCGNIMDIEVSETPDERQKIEDAYHCHCENRSLLYYGVCETCGAEERSK